jgi:hypothetical protein
LGRVSAAAAVLASSKVVGSFTLFFSNTSRQTYQKAGKMYQGIA